jgi:predicted GH43/DUF377 family glycosyl hydrolase
MRSARLTAFRPLAACPAAVLLLLLSGCGRYAGFSLPPLPPGDERATFTWSAHPEPVLARGGASGWDAGDALNPSVVRAGGEWMNVYSGFDGHVWRTGVATSPDGLAWRRGGARLAPDPATWEGAYIAANGAALLDRGRLFYWYQAGPKDSPRIGLARDWRKEAAPALAGGPRSSWDERAVGDPHVLKIGNWFYLYYLGQDRARRQRLGLARSTDGVTWEKLRSNPVLELGGAGAFDEVGLGEPAVWQSHGYYWMLYTGRDTAEQRRTGLARSSDGVHWRKLPPVLMGDRPWNAKVLCDPAVAVEGDIVRVWFGGGDVASPDENLHGQIGYGELHPSRLP